MTANQIKDHISQTLENIVEQTAAMMQHHGDVPQIEIDITLASIRDLYTSVQHINKVEIAVAPQVVAPPVVEEIITAPVIEAAPEPIIEAVVEEEIAIPEPEISIPTPVMPEPAAIQTPSASQDLFSDAAPVESKKTISEPKRTLFEQAIGQKADERISDKLKPISSIKQAIGINEKYQFMNTLFKGNQEDYIQTINGIDACDSLNSASSFMDTQKQQFGWKEENELNTLQKLNDLIQRKFSA